MDNKIVNFRREYLLNTADRWEQTKKFIDANFKGFADSDKPLHMTITTAGPKRNAEQNKRYWKAVLQQIAAQVWIDGKQFTDKIWHEYYGGKFGYHEEIRLPNGELQLRRKSTTEMSVKEFATYMTKIEADAAQELGVRFIDDKDMAYYESLQR